MLVTTITVFVVIAARKTGFSGLRKLCTATTVCVGSDCVRLEITVFLGNHGKSRNVFAAVEPQSVPQL